MGNQDGLDNNIIDFESLIKNLEAQRLDNGDDKATNHVKNEYLCGNISHRTYKALKVYLENTPICGFKTELARTLESYHNSVASGKSDVFIERLTELFREEDLSEDVYAVFRVLLLSDAKGLDLD
jgi:hypothetical protein